MLKIRDNKEWYETLKYEELLKFFDASAKNNHIVKNKRKIDEINPGDILERENKKKKRKGGEKLNCVLDQFKDTNTEYVIYSQT